MLVLKADPWLPDYGMGFDVSVDEAPVAVDVFVESDDWTTPRTPAGAPGRHVFAFVDGVRRAEIRLVADLEANRALGLFGSYAVGSVMGSTRPRVSRTGSLHCFRATPGTQAIRARRKTSRRSAVWRRGCAIEWATLAWLDARS